MGTFVLLLLLATNAGTSPAHPPPGRDRYLNPTDFDAFIAAQEEPGRAAWQKPEQILDSLELRSGQTVCDIGAGPGYFALRAAKRVGPAGRVFAVDVDPRIVDALRTRLERTTLRNVTPVLALADDPLLPPASCDVLLLIDVYHHFPQRGAYLKRIVPLLRPGGRIAGVDWKKGPTPIGPPQDHRVSREEFLGDAAKAGLAVIAEPTFLPHHYFVILAAKPRAGAGPR